MGLEIAQNNCSEKFLYQIHLQKSLGSFKTNKSCLLSIVRNNESAGLPKVAQMEGAREFFTGNFGITDIELS